MATARVLAKAQTCFGVELIVTRNERRTMPNFSDIPAEAYQPISEPQKRFVESLIRRTPDVLGPVATQLPNSLVADPRNGWLVFKVRCGVPCWIESPFTPPLPVGPGPQGLWDVLFWFYPSGMLEAIELLMFDENERADCEAMATWLDERLPRFASFAGRKRGRQFAPRAT